MHYSGSCHCGAIQFQFEGPEITAAMGCNCSICRRRNAILTEFTVAPGDITIEVDGTALSSYAFDSKVAKHHFCNVCGIFTFVETRLNPGEYRINLGCVEGVNIFKLPIEIYDGESL